MSVTHPGPEADHAEIEAEAEVELGRRRARIDALDTQIIALVEERCRVSADIQRARMSAGGPRVVHAREAEVVAQWRGRLGAPGGRIALALLELGRGR